MPNSLTGRKAIVVTVSDRCSAGTQVDLSGPAVAETLRAAGMDILAIRVVADEREAIAALLLSCSSEAALVMTTGGTGLAPRDVTPEATAEVCERLVPGLAERIRAEGVKETPFAALGRGLCGARGKCLIINLPGSPRGAVNAAHAVLPLLEHALDLLNGQTQHG
ncbi:MAG: MogA/MoaB family molybdenum cofactor biosynthesis protein [Bryocella sp.]